MRAKKAGFGKDGLFNVRLLKKGGVFVFDDKCFMHRAAPRMTSFDEWVTASNSDRRLLAAMLNCYNSENPK